MYEVELRLPSHRPYSYANIVVRTDSMEEMEHRLSEEVQHLVNTVGVTLETANAIFTLAEGGLPGEAVQETAPAAAPAKPWEKAAAPAAAPAKPWEKKAAAAPQAAAAEDNTLRVKFEFVDTDENPEAVGWLTERSNWMKTFFAEHKNSFSFDKASKSYKFHHAPNPQTKAALMARLEEFGGTVVSS